MLCRDSVFLYDHLSVHSASQTGSLRDREVAWSASDRQGSNFESCVWRTVSSQSSHHLQEVLLAQFSLYVHKGGLKPDSFHFIFSVTDTCDPTKPNNTIDGPNVVLMLGHHRPTFKQHCAIVQCAQGSFHEVYHSQIFTKIFFLP